MKLEGEMKMHMFDKITKQLYKSTLSNKSTLPDRNKLEQQKLEESCLKRLSKLSLAIAVGKAEGNTQ